MLLFAILVENVYFDRTLLHVKALLKAGFIAVQLDQSCGRAAKSGVRRGRMHACTCMPAPESHRQRDNEHDTGPTTNLTPPRLGAGQAKPGEVSRPNDDGSTDVAHKAANDPQPGPACRQVPVLACGSLLLFLFASSSRIPKLAGTRATRKSRELP
jgi:hypothetical protein